MPREPAWVGGRTGMNRWEREPGWAGLAGRVNQAGRVGPVKAAGPLRRLQTEPDWVAGRTEEGREDSWERGPRVGRAGRPGGWGEA
jgi:hypothetical protein